METHCPLCFESAELFTTIREKEYYQCFECCGIFLSPQNYLSLDDEKRRYLKHNNDINNVQYQKYALPIVELIKKHFNKTHRGLDFGCGTGPVISKLLIDQGYNIKQYDPFFFDHPELLKSSYDYIVCCEVIEHFKNPAKEFKMLRSMLKPGGKLICKTEKYSPEIDFKNWYYKNDATHVFFYQEKTFDWIKAKLRFSAFEMDLR